MIPDKHAASELARLGQALRQAVIQGVLDLRTASQLARLEPSRQEEIVLLARGRGGPPRPTKSRERVAERKKSRAERYAMMKRMRAEGLSVKRIAQEMGIVGRTVYRVLSAAPRPKAPRPKAPPPRPKTDVSRCRQCGYLVEMPCLVCQARTARIGRV